MSKEETPGIIDIHGKQYRTVAFRVNLFRTEEKYEGWSLDTDLIKETDKEATMKATIKDSSDRTIATGIAMEVRGSSNINKTSHIENCETSAVGRALANLGLGGTEYASADEVANAILQQAQAAVVPGETERQKAERVFFEKLQYDVKTGICSGTVVELAQATEYVNKTFTPDVIKHLSVTINHFSEILNAQDKANAA